MLSAGYGDVYEMGKVFRIDESGRYHNPEFTMLEWYRCGIDHLTLIDEVHDLLRSLHGDTCPSLDKVSYRELWLRVSGIDLAHADAADVAAFLESQGCEVPPSAAGNIDTVLDLGMATVIAASLPKDGYTCIYNYPASQASLARIDTDDRQWPVAHRFEFYFGSVELANGYHELNNAQEQRSRFEADNAERVRSGREAMPLDMRFVDSVDHLPDCAGVAIGMDRLLMILLPHISSLQQVLSFDWNQA